jgi:DNA polymerase III delta subunit
MKIKDAVSQLKQGRLENLYLIAGNESFLRELAVKSLLPLLQIQEEEWNITTLRDGAGLIGNLESLPLMSERRAVVCDISDIPEEELSRLASYLPDMPKSTVLLLTKASAPDKRKPLEKTFLEKGTVVECPEPSESESIDFICAYAAKNGVKFSRNDAHTFYRYVSGDLRHQVNELSKLIAVAGDEITKKDIQKYTVKSADYNIFKLHDLLLEKKWREAEILLGEILDEDASPIGLISILASNFELMLIARACLDAGYGEDKTKKSIMDASKAAEFRARRAIGQSRLMGAQAIRQAIRKLSKLDFDAKQGNVVLKNDFFAILMKLYSPV